VKEEYRFTNPLISKTAKMTHITRQCDELIAIFVTGVETAEESQ
jgi:hypothetical protein